MKVAWEIFIFFHPSCQVGDSMLYLKATRSKYVKRRRIGMDTKTSEYAVNTKEIGRKGRKLFEAISEPLEKEHWGKAIVIDVETGDYFIGKTGIEATKKAREKYPDKIFFLGKIGYRTYVSFKGRR